MTSRVKARLHRQRLSKGGFGFFALLEPHEDTDCPVFIRSQGVKLRERLSPKKGWTTVHSDSELLDATISGADHVAIKDALDTIAEILTTHLREDAFETDCGRQPGTQAGSGRCIPGACRLVRAGLREGSG